MRRRWTVGLCTVATLVMGCVLVTTAFAAPPEFGRCVKVTKGTGKFITGTCTAEAAGGSFEWLPGPGAKNKFTLATVSSTSVTLVETVKGTKIVCTGGTAAGEYVSATTVELAVRLEGCSTSGGKVENPGQPEGVVMLEPLTGVLGVVKKARPRTKTPSALTSRPRKRAVRWVCS